jgi:phospholipid/cholesterol/gamma-HCH transport system substrate-binding protein
MSRHPFFRDLLTGIVGLCGVAALVIMLWRFGELYRFTQKTYPLSVRMTNSAGLSESSGVTLNGNRVGSVTRITNTPEGVLVYLSINEPTEISAAMTAFIDRSFVGEGSLDFRLPAEPDSKLLSQKLTPGETLPPTSKPPIPSAGLLAEIADSVKGPIAKLGKAADRIETLAITLDDATKKFADMIEPRTLAEVDSGQKAPNLRTTLARADLAMTNANKWIGDDTLLANARASFAKLNATLDDAQKLPATVEKAVSEASGKVTDISAKLSSAIDEAQTTMKNIDEAAANLKRITSSVQNGEGTLGQLVRNPDLYNNLNSAAQRLETALDQGRMLIEKFKAEGLPLKLK